MRPRSHQFELVGAAALVAVVADTYFTAGVYAPPLPYVQVVGSHWTAKGTNQNHTSQPIFIGSCPNRTGEVDLSGPDRGSAFPLNFTGGATWTCGTVASYWPGGWCDDTFHLTVAPPFRILNATYPEHFPGCLGLMDGFVSLELQVPPDSGMYSLDATLWVTAGS